MPLRDKLLHETREETKCGGCYVKSTFLSSVTPVLLTAIESVIKEKHNAL